MTVTFQRIAVVLGGMLMGCQFPPPPDIDVDSGPPMRLVTVSLDVGSGGGEVTADAGGIACGVSCMAQLPEGARITFTANAASGSSFSGWRQHARDCGNESTCTLTVSNAPLAVGARFAADGTSAWAAHIGGAGIETGSWVARSNDGSSTVAITFRESFTHEGTPYTHVDGEDTLLLRLSSAGDTLWTRVIAGGGPQFPEAVATTMSGDVIVFGSYGATTDFGGPSSLPIAANDRKDFFVVKYEGSSGSLLWQRAVHASDNDDPGLGDLAIDEAGDVYVLGAFNSSIDFGDGALTSTIPGENEVFLAKFAGGTGDVLWKRRIGGAGASIFGNSLTLSRNLGVERIYVGGYCASACSPGGSTIQPMGARDGFLSMFDVADGGFAGQRQVGGAGDDAIEVISMSSNGMLYVAMNSTAAAGGSISFAQHLLPGPGTGYEIIVGAFDSQLQSPWAQRFGGSGNDAVTDLDVLTDGSIIVMGDFTSPSLSFGDTVIDNSGLKNLYVARLAPATGMPTWASALPANLASYVGSLDAAGNTLTLGGGFNTQIELLGITLTSRGATDAFASAISLPSAL